MADKIDTLILVGHGTADSERATVPFVLANLEVEKPGRRVEVILTFQGVTLAVRGTAAGFHVGPPWDSFDLEQRMKSFMEKGGIISACTPCLAHRNLLEAELLEGVVKIKGTDLLDKKDLAEKLLSFL